MAATPFDIPAPGSSYAFDIYNDAHTLGRPAQALPGGPCNYTDATLPRCGCRRFWSRASLSSGVFQDNLVSNVAELCMCSHHACFHEDVQPGQTQQPALANAPEQENQRPNTNREPLSPVQLPSFHMPGSLGSSLDFTLLDFQTSMSAPRIEATNPPQAEDARPGQDSPMPDTFNNWGDLARSQAAHANASGLPPFPAQCLMSPPPPPSTAASSQARYLRPFAGRGLQTLSGVSAARPDSRRLEGGIQDGGVEMVQDAGRAPTVASTPKASPSQDRSVAGLDASAYRKLADRVDTHEQRLDRLDTTSFSVAGHEECHDKHEHTDLRVTELESRVDEVEKILNDNGSVVSSRRAGKQDGGADDATASVVSVSTNATVLASSRAEVYSQIQQLQAQVTQLQAAAMPSYTKPWELEVVFLPYPLKGVWIEAKEFPAQRRSIGSNVDDWTQLPNTISRATPDPQSPKFQEWAGQGPESNWLLPRAFAAGRVIDQRLKSRGLIKTVSVRGADARSVQLAIHAAFEDVLRISSTSDARSGFAPDYPLAEFLGLRQAWVPLRKLHKDSRLRFLSPAEMATPALWDFTFLASSVVMKATGIQRLYITQPEAYLQDHPLGYRALEAGWTWQKLRQLSRVYPDSQSSTAGDVPEADALEECWNWNDRLDESPAAAATPSISLRHSIHQRSSRRSSTEPSGQFYTGVQSPILSAVGPSRSRAPSPLIQRERKGSWPPHIRTGSLPPVSAALLSPAQSRRRLTNTTTMAQTPYERRSSPFVPAAARASPRMGSSLHTVNANVPKRRFTRSPSLVPRNTPRWSRSPSLAPPGNGLYGDSASAREREQQNRERRTTTPFYYATPHSEAIPEFGYHRAGSKGPSNVGGGGQGLRMGGGGYDPDEGDDEDLAMGDDDDDEEFTSSGTDLYEEGDSEMLDHHHHPPPHHGHHHPHHRHHQQQGHPGQGYAQYAQYGSRQRNGSFGFGTDGDEADLDLDIDVYEDEDGEEDELDGVDTDAGNTTDNVTAGGDNARVWHGFDHRHPHRRGSVLRQGGPQQQQQQQQQQQPLRPEDIPWAGIEDGTAAGAGVFVDLDAEGDSNMSDGENVDPTSQSSLSQSQSQRGGVGIGGGGGGGVIHHDENAHQHHQLRISHDGEDDDDDDAQSSQAPSEYSSKPGPWQIISVPAGAADEGPVEGQKQGRGGGGESSVMGFRIHEDGTAGPGRRDGDGEQGGEEEEELLDTQWG
ncbi:hypothetical protein NEMBOFW57_006162 [Staphylotrichum longicolle]|uniref:Uncharacterized protein n=1 Tax=Staphylotrichum longicolle TaxID=669026 RepID=A0AAD4I0B6_9PEZI|nr:hypothetical protein NEMBOFW57_006162 [Staphylotrichum longicolle]